MPEPGEITIEVAFALPDSQRIIEMTVPTGTTARRAALMSKMDSIYPEVDLLSQVLGIFGEQVDDDVVLEAGDRVELYRPLVTDPMEQRRQRAAQSAQKSARLRKNGA